MRKIEDRVSIDDITPCSHQKNNYRNTLGETTNRTTSEGGTAAANREWRPEGVPATDEALLCRF